MTTHLGRRPVIPEPEALMRIDMTPLAMVMLMLVLLLTTALPRSQHMLGTFIGPFCGAPPEKDPVVHTVSIDFDGTVYWDEQALPSRAALDARMQGVGVQSPRDQAEVHIHPSPLADYSAVLAVLVSASQHGAVRLGMVGHEPDWRYAI